MKKFRDVISALRIIVMYRCLIGLRSENPVSAAGQERRTRLVLCGKRKWVLRKNVENVRIAGVMGTIRKMTLVVLARRLCMNVKNFPIKVSSLTGKGCGAVASCQRSVANRVAGAGALTRAALEGRFGLATLAGLG